MTHPTHNESARLAAIAKLELLGAPEANDPGSPALDRLVRLAAMVFDVPICAVSLVGENEEWFRARVGITASCGPRETAFCTQTILSQDVLIVENALTDARFCDNPQVTGPDAIRFYAGAPIIAPDGGRVGAFCIKDRKPREFSPREAAMLEHFAALALGELVGRLTLRAADAARRAKTSFLASMNYAVRTPLTSIFGFSELLAEAGLSDEDRAEAASSIRRNGEQLVEFIDDAMLLAELETGGVTPRPRDFVLADLLRDVESVVSSAAKARGLAVCISTMIDVPATLHADPVLLRHALSQLFSNAVKYTEHGSVELRVRNADASGRVVFEVSDTGRGMDAEMLANLWQGVEHAHARGTRGVGMGMPIVARSATLLGGGVKARSTPGCGSTFTLEISAGAGTQAGEVGSGGREAA